MSIKDRFYGKLNEAREQLDELTGYRKKKLFGKDPIGAVSRRAVDRMTVMPKNEKEKAQNAKSSKILRWAADRSDERPLDEEQLNELRGKGTLDKKDKEELQGRIRKKHGEAWTETERIRKEKKSKGSEDTKKIDKYRNRLAKIHNKLDEEQLDEVSKKTLASYIKKASHDVATKSAATGRYADRANKARDKMKKGDYSDWQQGKKDDEFADKMFKKSWNRRKGIAKAADKLAK